MAKTKSSSPSSASSGVWEQIKYIWKKTKAFLDRDGVLPWIINLLIAFIVIKFVVYPLLGFLFGTSLPVVAVVSSSMDHDAIDGSICGQRLLGDSYRGSFDDFWSACGSWYEARNVSKEQFREFSFRNGFKKGDIMLVLGEKRSAISQGDILIFSARANYPIIHRVVSITNPGPLSAVGKTYATKGDHNADQIAEYVLVDAFGNAWRCERDGLPVLCASGSPVTSQTPGGVRIIDETAITNDQIIGKAVLRVPWLGYVKIWFTDLVVWIAGVL